MRKIESKIPAMIGLLFSLLSFALLIVAFIDLKINPQATQGVSTSFAWWVCSVITAMLAVAAYQVDGILNIIRAINGYRRAMHIMLAMVATVSLPMVIYVGGGLGINILIWNVHHLVLCTMEAISIVCLIKDRCRDQIICFEGT